MVTLKAKLFLPWSNNIVSKIKDCENKLHHHSRTLQEVCVICQTSREESQCQAFSDHQVAIKTALVYKDLPFYIQAEQLKEFLHAYIHKHDAIYILLKKETSQIGHLLTQICATAYPEQIFYLTEDDQTISSPALTLTEETHFSLIQYVNELIYSGNYSSAQVLLDESLSGKHSEINELLNLGNQLFLLNLDKENVPGKQHPLNLLMETLAAHDISDREELDYLRRLMSVQDQKQRPFIAVLHNYAEFLYEQDDIIDFIVLYYRLAEETLLFALGWDHDWNNQFIYREDAGFKLAFPKWRLSKHYHRYNQALREYIQTVEAKKRVQIRSSHQAAIENLTSEEAYFAQLYLAFANKGIVQCIEFRHEGVSGHGFADLTKKELENLCSGKTPLQLIDPLLKRLGLKPEHSIFELLNKGIMALLQEQDNASGMY
ncbi:hypothetical protein [Neobacillus muris]|uniref:hypothetical protein n=1 Tax=Neobacillus muris TaxID=2941334 RepID=UPI00203DEA25|nr:hypothetical protein [Neobacillus muris]